MQEPWPDSLHGCLDAENTHFSILKNIESENKDEDEYEEKKNIINKNTKILHAPGYDYQVIVFLCDALNIIRYWTAQIFVLYY